MEEHIMYYPHSGESFLAPKLLHCPFCGHEAELIFIGNDYSKVRQVKIKCTFCNVIMINSGIRTASEVIARRSINSWNTRG